MKKQCVLFMLLLSGILLNSLQAAVPKWVQLNNIEQTDDGFKTLGTDPWLISEPFAHPIPAENSYMLIELSTSRADNAQIYWQKAGQNISETQSAVFNFAASNKPVKYVVDLGSTIRFDGLESIRFDPSNGGELKFQIHKLQFVPPSGVPSELLPGLLNFRCYTSKLHYIPGERIEYQAVLFVRSYPDRQSSKILEVNLFDSNNCNVGSAVQQYGLRSIQNVKELQGVIELPRPLAPGKYKLIASSTDQRSGLRLEASHDFGIQGPNDPFIYETPFKFIKDFSIIRSDNGLWHIFSITGDLRDGHGWVEDGQERTFSHATSPDLRHWTYHRPVLSISDANYPDGNGRYKNRNIWAPYVIKYNNLYYMFYTSVNEYVSQSISVAMSKDLFEWKDYDKNPVLTLENVNWANWHRNCWADLRDPVVYSEGDKFYLYATAQAAEGQPKGVIAVAESNDLLNWDNPQIAVRGPLPSESPQVWKSGKMYYMTSGAGSYISDNPVYGWKKDSFPPVPVPAVERYISTSVGWADEIVLLEDGSFARAAMTFRFWGNSIYIFRLKTDMNGRPVGHESPFIF